MEEMKLTYPNPHLDLRALKKSLPLLVGVLAGVCRQELLVIVRRGRELFQVVVGGSAQEVSSGRFRQVARTRVQCPDGHHKIFILGSRHGEVSVGFFKVRT